MTLNQVLIIQIRAELKKALELVMDGKSTEAEAQKLLQNLRSFNNAARQLEAPSVKDSPELHIQVEPTSRHRHSDDNEPARDPEETQSIVIDDWRNAKPTKK